jgi:hypothetical protein
MLCGITFCFINSSQFFDFLAQEIGTALLIEMYETYRAWQLNG